MSQCQAHTRRRVHDKIYHSIEPMWRTLKVVYKEEGTHTRELNEYTPLGFVSVNVIILSIPIHICNDILSHERNHFIVCKIKT